jgi:hypothetical protein
MTKIKELLDSRSTWVMLAGIAGAFGEKALGITNAIGALVMAIL